MLTRTRLATLLFCCAVIYGQAVGQSGRPTSSSAEAKQLRKEQKATRAVPADFGDATLWLDPTKWVQYSSEIGAVRFNNVNKHVLGWMLSDKTGGIPTSAMKDMAIRNAQRQDPNARMDREERRIVNGREVLYLEITLSQNSIPIRFAGYYHGGAKSNIQVVAYCIAADVEVYRKDVDEFINGIEIREGSSLEK